MKKTMKTENDRLERTPKMKRRTDYLAAWSNLSGTLLTLTSSGALMGLIALTAVLVAVSPVNAQSEISIQLDVAQELEKELEEAAIEVQEALEEIGLEKSINIHFDEDNSESRPKLGVYLNNMDFEDAYKMRYPYAHGVLVNGTVNNGAADKAGIIEDDIIMYFDGTKVRYEDHLVRLIRSKHFGDSVKLVYWRDEAMDSTVAIFEKPEKKEKTEKQLAVIEGEKKEKKRKHSRGFGGGGFTPMLVQDEFVDVTAMMNQLGLTSSPFNKEGIVLFGGSGQGYVGNGWFLGGFGNGTAFSNSVEATHSVSGIDVDRKISFAMGYGGLTIEKRMAPFSFATIGAGVGLGGGSLRLGIEQTDGGFTWDPTGLNSLSDQLIDTKTTAVTFSKNYALVHPRANVMIRLTSWMRLKAEYGYLYGHSFTDGWKTTLDGGDIDTASETFILEDSPDTEMNASTVSLGLWFGF